MPLRPSSIGSLFFIAVCAIFLTGCSTSFDPLAGTAPPATALGTIHGKAYGGQGPINGAKVYLYQVGINGYYSSSTSLAGSGYATTDPNGSFSITTYAQTCVSGYPVYLYSVGGDSGSGPNSAAGLMAALGPCPATGTLAQAYPFVNMNELSTVAMAYAVAGFATDATDIGVPASDPLAEQGIVNAFATAQNIYSITSTYPTSTALATTTNAAGTLPQFELNTLADILAGCINSSGPTSSNCSSDPATMGLFYYATSNGTPSGNIPGDTATAAIYIAQNSSANAAGLWSLVAASGTPFQNALSAAPTDFSLTIYYGLANLGGASSYPRQIAVDASGDVWAVSGGNADLDELSPLGAGLQSINSGLHFLSSIAVDNGAAATGTAIVYVSDEGQGNVDRFNADTGAYISQYGSGTKDGSPFALTIDGTGNIWTANQEDNAVAMQTPTGTSTATEYKPGGSYLDPNMICAAQGTPTAVFSASLSGDSVFSFSSTGASTNIGSPHSGLSGDCAVDNTTQIWLASSNYAARISATGSLDFLNTSITSLHSVAIDGNGNGWFTSTNKEIFELNAAGAILNGASGFASLPNNSPQSIAIDGSGNVWYNQQNSGTLSEIIGAAAPVATPLAYGTANNKLGGRP